MLAQSVPTKAFGLLTSEDFAPEVALKCPLCGDHYCHIRDVRRNEKLYDMGGYGNVTIEMQCENDNHKWFIVLNDYKGQVYVETRTPSQVYDMEGTTCSTTD